MLSRYFFNFEFADEMKPFAAVMFVFCCCCSVQTKVFIFFLVLVWKYRADKRRFEETVLRIHFDKNRALKTPDLSLILSSGFLLLPAVRFCL